MNGPILRLFVLILLLLAVLVGFTSYWAVFDADALKQRAENRRSVIETASIRRGSIRSFDGTLIAHSVPIGHGEDRVFERRYPLGALFGHPVGYSFIQLNTSGIERSENGVLTGDENEFETLLDELSGTPREGSNLTLTLDANAQRVATDALAGQPGSVVAIEPATGAIRAMVSVPGYDPNAVPDSFSELNADPGSPLFDRATQSGYPPGSTFKVVTAAAALDSGEFTPATALTATSPMEIGGVPLENFGGQSFGSIDMTTALTSSVNTYFAQVGERLGQETLLSYMQRFGFYSKPPLDYPADQIRASGLYDGSKLLKADEPIDVGRTAIGQERLAVTPLQMAMVAAAIGNDGELMRPTFIQRIEDPDGRTSYELDPDRISRAIGTEAAAQLGTMMERVVQEGSGTAAALSGISVAGKTGTAEHGITERCPQPNQAWFIGYAPAGEPQIAVAATVECTSGTGGVVAAPIVRQVMEAIL